jgi:hypothetical protein
MLGASPRYLGSIRNGRRLSRPFLAAGVAGERQVGRQEQELTMVVQASASNAGSLTLPGEILAVLHAWGERHGIPPASLPQGWQSNVDKDAMELRFTFAGKVPLEEAHALKQEVEGGFEVTAVDFALGDSHPSGS